MEDRQHFDVHTLKNGITVYSHSMDVPFFSLNVVIPYGHGSSIPENPGGVPGIAHFLEHIVMNRSEKYPEKDAFSQELSLQGSHINASTNIYRTNLYGSAPVTLQEKLVQGLFSHVWHPILDNQEDLGLERTIVANERNQKKYYPGNNEVSQYLYSQWFVDYGTPKQQIFGNDEDLNSMGPEQLKAFHEMYFTNSSYVVVGGGHDITPILEQLEEVPTRDVEAKKKIEPISWGHKEFHEHTFKDLDTPTYYRGGFVSSFDIDTSYNLSFLLNLLTNTVHGPLFEWTRKQKGWTYGVSSSTSDSHDDISWRIKMPLNQIDPLDEIRSEIDKRIQEAVSDEELIKTEVRRRAFNDIYAYQTLDDRMGQAMYSINYMGRVYTEKEFKEMNEKINSKILKELYDIYLTPEAVGEFLALPEKS